MGFHNSFNKYCEWCETNEERLNWGEWWETIELPRQQELINKQEIK